MYGPPADWPRPRTFPKLIGDPVAKYPALVADPEVVTARITRARKAAGRPPTVRPKTIAIGGVWRRNPND